MNATPIQQALVLHRLCREALAPLVDGGAYDRRRDVRTVVNEYPPRISLLDVEQFGDALNPSYVDATAAMIERLSNLRGTLGDDDDEAAVAEALQHARTLRQRLDEIDVGR